MQRAGRSTVRRTQAQPQTARQFTVQAGAATYTVLVTRKRVKNLNLRVRADGSVVASVPPRVSDARIQEFLDGRAHWIAEHVERQRAARERGDGYDDAHKNACAIPDGIVRFHCRLPSFHKNKKGCIRCPF